MINDLFLKKALNISKEYLMITNDINMYEKMVSEILNSLDSNSKELEDLKEKINSNKITDIEFAKSEMLNIIINLEDDTNKTGKHINILNERIEKLRKDEVDLYREIREKYPEMFDDDIKEEIQSYIKSLS